MLDLPNARETLVWDMMQVSKVLLWFWVVFFSFYPVWKNNLKCDIMVYFWNCIIPCLQVSLTEEGHSGGSQPVKKDWRPGFCDTITNPLWDLREVTQPLWALFLKWGHLGNKLSIVLLVLCFYDIMKSADGFSKFYCMFYVFPGKQTNNSALIIYQANLKLQMDLTAGQSQVRKQRFMETQKLM